jgi:hypothetical protein
MLYIIILLPITFFFLGRRVYAIIRHIRNIGKNQRVEIRLSWSFYIEEAVTIFVVCLFMIALSPVESIYAIAAIIGVFLDTLITIFYYSIRAAEKSIEDVRVGAVL